MGSEGNDRVAEMRLRREGGTKEVGRVLGMAAPVAFFLLIKNIATANSSLDRLPVPVMSERSQICANTDAGRREFMKN